MKSKKFVKMIGMGMVILALICALAPATQAETIEMSGRTTGLGPDICWHMHFEMDVFFGYGGGEPGIHCGMLVWTEPGYVHPIFDGDIV